MHTVSEEEHVLSQGFRFRHDTLPGAARGFPFAREYIANLLATLAQVMSISQMMRSDFGPDRSLSGIGGVETGRDAAEFLLLGAQTVQARLHETLHVKTDSVRNRSEQKFC